MVQSETPGLDAQPPLFERAIDAHDWLIAVEAERGSLSPEHAAWRATLRALPEVREILALRAENAAELGHKEGFR
jgi:hypothetical protein